MPVKYFTNKVMQWMKIIIPILFISSPVYAHAQLLGIDVANIAENSVIGLINLFNLALAKVVAFFAFILNWTFDIQEITSIDVIQFAWSVSRDFANMFFILILLVIAFATILRYEPYGIKRLLPKLIVVALLINFSMVGAGIIIDLGSSLGHFFVTGGAYNQDAGDVGANIAAAVGISSLNDYRGYDRDLGIADATSAITDALFALVLVAIIAFLFIMMAGFMIVRLVALWMLVIFVPLALISWVIPAAQRYWRMWWDKFFAWAFFPAIYGIFIYFALIIGNAFKRDIFTELGSTVDDSSLFTVTLQSFLQMLIVVFILLAGLKYARSAGLDGAGLVVKWGDKGRDALLGYTKSGAKFAGKSAVKAAPEPLRRKIREGVEKIPLAGRAIGGPGARHKEFIKRIKEQEKEMKDLRPQDLRAIADQKVATEEGRARRAAAIKQLAEKGKLEERDKKHFGDFLTAGGDAKAVLQNMPTWILDEKIQELLAKHPATATDWAPVVGTISGSAGRVALAKRTFRKKMLPQKPKEFSKTSKSALDVYDDEISGRELQVRREILAMYVKEFQEGGRFHANALSALANDNPQAYEVLVRRLNEKHIYDTLQDGVKKFLKSGPVAAFDTSTPSAPAEEKTT